MSQYKIAAEIKEQILSRVKEGVAVSRLAEEHGVSNRTIYGWLSKKSLSVPSALEFGRLKRERDELLKMVGKLTLELAKEKKGR